jgi:hypothetical protein
MFGCHSYFDKYRTKGTYPCEYDNRPNERGCEMCKRTDADVKTRRKENA